MKITIVNPANKKINQGRLQKSFDLIIQSLLKQKIRNKKMLLQKKEIVFIFLSLQEMRRINKTYRSKDKPTDVLSFESADPETLGELALCLPVLMKQAKSQKHSVDQELQYMMIHGLLHLLGYDHELSKSEEVLMFRLQDLCFEQVCHLRKTY